MSDKQRNLVIRAITGAFFVVLMVAGILYSCLSMTILFAIITGMTIWEYTGLINQSDKIIVNRFISTAAGVYLYLAFAGYCSGFVSSAAFIPYLLTIVYLFISELYTKNENAINDWAYTMLAQMYIALPLSMTNVLAFLGTNDGSTEHAPILPMSIFIFLWTNDTGAYCSGSLFGKHKLFPRISPGKSWEGSIGGSIFVIIAANLVYFLWASNLENNGTILSTMNITHWIGLGLVVVVFGTWGDLVESLFKRTLGIKDSGNILPGHGGMLDRFDSSLMAIPAATIYLYTITMF
jgi:phosphatidate cytidylyltransferase